MSIFARQIVRFAACLNAAIAVTSLGSSADALDLLQTLEEQPKLGCADVPFLERAKFSDCRPQFLLRDLPDYRAQREADRVARVEREQQRIWDFLETPPAENCDIVPELEAEKFSVFCRKEGSSTDIVASLSWDLDQLRAQRDSFARKIDDLRATQARLKARQAELDRINKGASNGLDAQVATKLLSQLDSLKSQAETMQRIGPFMDDAKLPGEVQALRFIRASGAVALFETDAPDAQVLVTVRAGETLIAVETNEVPSGLLPVIHPVFGLGYADSAALAIQP